MFRAESTAGGELTEAASEQRQSQEPDDLALQVPHVVPPDGGWGWVIVGASFMCNAIVDGFIFSFGIMLLPLVDEFGESKSKTAWIGSILSGFYLIAGETDLGPYSTSTCLCLVYNAHLLPQGKLSAAIGVIWPVFKRGTDPADAHLNVF